MKLFFKLFLTVTFVFCLDNVWANLTQASSFFNPSAYAHPPGDDFDDDIDDDIERSILSDIDIESVLSLDELEELSGFDTFTDDIGNFALAGEVLVLMDAVDLPLFKAQGYLPRDIRDLPALKKIMAKIETPLNVKLATVQSDIKRFAPNAHVDLNHIFRPENGRRRMRKTGYIPSQLLEVKPPLTKKTIKIGMIDTSIRTQHPVFNEAHIITKNFVTFNFKQPTHGTAVASILVGQSETYKGLLPEAELYAASVFFNSPLGKVTATTESLIEALDWLVAQDVKIINMSLAGPENLILESSIKHAFKSGVLIVAAVGNDGPHAAPLYPAAYPEVIAVTAIDDKQLVYRRANRGPQVDFPAPGVAIRNARGKTKYQTSSGTSYATPFATAFFALAQNLTGKSGAQLVPLLQGSAEDLGVAGYDPIYGYGLIKEASLTIDTP